MKTEAELRHDLRDARSLGFKALEQKLLAELRHLNERKAARKCGK